MSEILRNVIIELQKRLAAEEARVAEAQAAVSKTKSAINVLCEVGDMPPMFENIAPAAAAQSSTGNPGFPAGGPVVAPDQFFGRPTATVVREILEMRRQLGVGPTPLAEIHALMKGGGYEFDTRDEEGQVRGLAISISKNTALFVRLPNGMVGLTDWYGGAKRRAKKDAAPSASPDTAEAEEAVGNGDPVVVYTPGRA